MTTIVRLLLLLQSLAPVALFPQSRTDSVSRLHRYITPFSFMSLPQNGGGLEKKISVQSERQVITKIELSMWRDSQWKAHWIYNVLYDNYGRVKEYYRDPFFDGLYTSSDHTIFEYDPFNKMIRKLEYSTYSSTIETGKSEGCTDYYLNERNYPGISRPPFIALPYSEMLPTISAGFDSVNRYFSTWDRELGAMTSSDLHKYTFSYDDTAVWTVDWYRPSDLDSVRVDGYYRYHYCFNEKGNIDSIIYSYCNGTGPYETTDLYCYTYSGSRLTAMTHRSGDLTFHYDLSYTPQGRLSSYIEQYTSGTTPTRTNTSKVFYTYSTIPIVATDTPPRHDIPGRLQTEIKRNLLRLTVPPGTTIDRVMQFDLQGRCIKVYSFPHATRKESVYFPLPATGTGLRIVRVSTNRGNFNLPIGSSSVCP